MSLAGRTVFVTGGSRGIGLAIAKRAARDGANVVLAAKTAEPHPKLPGTIFTAAEECEKLGGKALPIQLNIQDDDAIQKALETAAEKFGGIDVLVNNASAIDNSETLHLKTKKYDLMHSINGRGTFMMTKFALPYLLKSKKHPKVLNLSPPLDCLAPPRKPATPEWFRLCGTGYTMAKFNMSMSAIGMAEEHRNRVAFNCLWPRTAIATSAIEMIAGDEGMRSSRTVDIMSDAAHWILTQDDPEVTGKCFVDEDVVTDANKIGLSASELSKYSHDPSCSALMPDFYVGSPSEFEAFMSRKSPPKDSPPPSNDAKTDSTSLEGKTVFVTGGSRGIGLAIAKRAARDGANVVLAAKTVEPHPKLPGTIFTAADECEKLGGKALPIQLNVQDDDAIQRALETAAEKFGGIDVLVNNASAIDNSETLHLKTKKYDLMHSINGRGTFMMTKFALPYLLEGSNAHVLNLSPPLDMDPRWFRMAGTGYTLAKFNMSMSAIGMAAEYRDRIGFNCLWPRTSIATAAVDMLAGTLGMQASRNVDIMSDTAHWILTQDSAKVTGNCFIDEDIVLDTDKMGKSTSDLDTYRINRWVPLIPDLFVGDPGDLDRYYKIAKKASGLMRGGMGSFFAGKTK
eukprot:g1468.t1